MATSGSVNGNNVSSGNDFYVTWSLSSQSVANNTSTISWNAYWRFNNSDAQLDNGNVNINGSSRWDNGGRVYNYSGNISTRNLKVASGSYTMSHNSDGTKSFSITGSLTQYIGETSSLSGSFSLPTIPRKSEPTFGKTTYKIGEPIVVNMNRKSSSFTHTVTIQVPDGTTVKTFTGVGSSFSWTPNSSEIALLYSKIPNAASVGMNAIATTYNGGSNLGSDDAPNVTLAADPTDVSPIFADFSYKDSNSATVAITGNDQYLIQGYSTLQATILAAQAATAQQSATMSKYNFAISNISSDQTYVATDIVKELGVLNVNTNTPLVVKAIDSRNYGTPVTKTINIVPYQPPLNTVTAKRLNDFETQTLIHIESVVSRLTVGGTDTNAVNSGSGVKYRYKKTTDVSWGSWNNVGSSLSSGNLSITDFNVNLDRNYAWNVQVTVTDKLATTTTDIQVSKGIPIFFIGDNGKVSINKLPENGDLDVDGDIYMGGRKVQKKPFRWAFVSSANQSTGTGGGDVRITYDPTKAETNGDGGTITNSGITPSISGWCRVSISLSYIGGADTDDSMNWGVLYGTKRKQLSDNWWKSSQSSGMEHISTFSTAFYVNSGEEIRAFFSGVQNSLTLMGGFCHFEGEIIPD